MARIGIASGVLAGGRRGNGGFSAGLEGASQRGRGAAGGAHPAGAQGHSTCGSTIEDGLRAVADSVRARNAWAG